MAFHTPEKASSAEAESPDIPQATRELMTAEQERIAAIRQFNRFYTRIIGVLDEKHLKSGFSLAEVRILYELAHRESVTAALLSRELGLDPGYLSRILSGFDERGLVLRVPSSADGRQSNLSLTEAGQRMLDDLDALARASVATLLTPLSESKREELAAAMRTIEDLLGTPA